jgi:hypothetical protein
MLPLDVRTASISESSSGPIPLVSFVLRIGGEAGQKAVTLALSQSAMTAGTKRVGQTSLPPRRRVGAEASQGPGYWTKVHLDPESVIS